MNLLLIAVDLASWALAPERRFARSAVVSGIVVGKVAAGLVR